MPLRLIRRSKRYLIPLTVLIYCITMVILLVWIERLKPTKPAEITQITFNEKDSTINIVGKNIPANFSALLTPNMQREQDTVSSQFTWGNAFNIAGANNHLWIANGYDGILSYDILNPKKPDLVGVLALGKFYAWNVTIDGNRALIAGGSFGLAGIDISNPTAPKHQFTIYQDETIHDSIIKDDTAIILSSKNGLLLLNIKGDTPKEIGRINLEGSLRSITQDANRAYVLGIKNKKGILYVIDITQPRQAKRITTIELPHMAVQCKKIGDTLLISMGGNGLFIADINTLTQKINSYRIEEIAAFGLCVSEHDVFISNRSHHIHHYRIKNNQLTHIKTLLTAGKIQNIMLFNHHLVACLGKKGFAIFDPSKENTTTPPTIKLNKKIAITPDILQKGKYFAIPSLFRLNLFTVSKNNSMSQYDSITFASKISVITMDHRYVYVALLNSKTHVIDLDPKALKRTKKIITWNTPVPNLVVDRDKLYFGRKSKGISVLNLEDLNTSQQITPFISMPHDNYAIKDNLLYLATWPNGLKIYQINDKTIPSLIGELKYPAIVKESSRATDMVIKDGYAFITNGIRGLLSVDVRDPKKPTIGDALDLLGFCSRIALQGNYAYITTGRTKTIVVDISDPLKMEILCDLPTTTAVAFSNNRIYQLNDIGVYINSLPRPLKIKKQSTRLMKFELPSAATEGYYDLQFATTQQITKHSDLLHYSQQQGWTMTREPTPSITNH